ncbi:MAG TPA: efflux transporter outer membrane subunit [Rhodanobacter sp.]|nr:efflux transporter outer membrane subunit [Rhodanobacter sp.]
MATEITRKAAVRAAAIISLSLLGGCTVGPNFHVPGAFSPASWFTGRPPPKAPSQPVVLPVSTTWWTLFNDPELTKLEQRVAAQNLDVRVATLRLAESRAQRNMTAGNMFPTLNGNASYTREQASKKGVFSALGGGSPASAASGAGAGTTASGASGAGGGGGIPGSSLQPFDLFQYGFDSVWQIDLWGQVRREIESANATIEATAAQRRAVLLTALAEVARDYIDLRGTQRQLQIARQNLQTADQLLKLTRERAAGGLTTDLDVANARAQRATIAAEIPQLEQQESVSINALSLLLGEPPNALRGELATPKPVPPIPPAVPVGLPGELLRRRPDIQQAEAKLHAATADVGVAVSDFFPQISLSGSVSLQALQAKDLANWAASTYAFGPSITLPIFQGGQLRAQLTLRKAQQKEAALTYQKTVLQAFHEVDNALTAYDAEQRRRAHLVNAVKQNKAALSLAQQRYRQGIANYIEVLDAERSLLSAQQTLATSTATVSTDLVAIYKALGGGWQTAFPHHPVQAAKGGSPARS